MQNNQIWVYDIETLASCFTYTAINIDTQEIVQYAIHKDRDDSVEFLEHLDQDCKGHIGFNNLNFDYPIIHKILMVAPTNTLDIIDLAYNEAQRIIQDQSQFGTSIKQTDIRIPQLDLFRMWHFNNKARRTSLKALQISMNYPNVLDMPIDHTRNDIRVEEIKDILEYNLNDVLSTYEFYKLSKDKIKLRKDLNIKYNLNCINFPDSKIGEELVLKLYSETIGQDKYDIKQLGTTRTQIDLGKCIFDYISFETPEFNKILDKFKNTVIIETKGSIEESVIYKGFKYDYGSGGIHGCIKAGVYESDNDYVIIDADVASLYPSIAVVNKLYPQHLGIEFCNVYEGILKQRIEAKKAGNMTLSDGFKLSLNSVYGKSNDKYSFLLDPEYTMKTTLNGQLMLSMLAEKLVTKINSIQMLQINTDGLTVKIHKKDLDNYYWICNDWQSYTNLSLEFVEYSKMIIRDVNNYFAVKTDGKCKYKGAFEIDKELHKDNSFRIIPLALSDYFIKGIPVEETIKNHKNIYDFCGRQKFTSESYGETHELAHKNGQIYNKITKQQKNVRYYISDSGVTFVKQYSKGSSEFIHKGYRVHIFNKYEKLSNYHIDYQFYIKECNKEINNIINKQLELF